MASLSPIAYVPALSQQVNQRRNSYGNGCD